MNYKEHIPPEVLGSVLQRRLPGLTGRRPLPSLSLSRKYDTCACFRIGPRVMVAQWDSKPPADIGQPGRVDAPLRARKPDRTGERQSRHTNSVPGATRLEHAPVKTRVVSRDELRLVEPGEQGGPEFAKGGCVADVFPAETMDPGELEPGFRRSDQEGPHSLNASVAPPRKADRARTVRLMIGGLEIDCDK